MPENTDDSNVESTIELRRQAQMRVAFLSRRQGNPENITYEGGDQV